MTGSVPGESLVLASRLLDQLEIGFCLYDRDDRVVMWNDTYLAFFPEQAAHIRPGLPYAATLARFFRSNLTPDELAQVDRHVEAGVARHRAQQVPFIFQLKTGRWLKVASLPLADDGRMRLWRDISAEQDGTAAGPSTARALAALDVAYALFDRNARFVTGNKRYQELFPDIGDLMLTGVPYRDHLIRIATGSLAPGYQEAVLALAERTAPAAAPIGLPRLFRRRNGGWLQIEERFGDDGTFVSTWVDATRRAEAEARIVRLEGHLRDAIDAIPHGFVLFDQDGRMTLANRRLAAIDAGLAAALVPGAPLAVIAKWRAGLPEGGCAEGHLERLRHALAEAEEFPLADGRWLRFQGFPTSNGDLLLLLTDITLARRADEELRRHRDNLEVLVADRTRALAAAKETAETARTEAEQAYRALREAQEGLVNAEKMASLGSLVAGVAHEINTPIGIGLTGASMIEETLRGLSRRAESGTLRRSELYEALDSATEAATLLMANLHRAAELVQSFKPVAADQASNERRSFDLALYVEEVMASLGPRLKQTPHRTSIDCPPGIVVDGFPGALSQILTNFVMNALLHAFEPDRPGRIAITGRLGAGDMVELRFADDGRGIPKAHLPRIFEPFFTTKRGLGGTGLGLNIVHNLVTGTLRGQIAVDSEEDGGTTFTLTFPRCAVTREDARRLTLAAAELIAAEGVAAARRRFHQPGPFRYGEVYVSVIDFGGTWVIYPPRPASEGQSVLALADTEGNSFVRQILALAQDPGEGWVDYLWANPQNGLIQPKTSFVKRVPGHELIAYVGVYRPGARLRI